ncbi:hypothetical protein KSS87_022912 [Heliosperma pusillum]|nr:hypothetical protein KSS87_022912 [Heliosperma pusillum]
MAQTQRVEGGIELKCDADKFFEIWARKPYLAASMSPDKHPKIELHEGDWYSIGSILTWNYVLGSSNLLCVPTSGVHRMSKAYGLMSLKHESVADDGERSFVRTKIEEIDEKNNSVSYNVVDGQVFKTFYKSFKPKVEATQKSGFCVVKWSFEFEKKNEATPEPTKYLDFLLGCAKDIDAHLCSA